MITYCALICAHELMALKCYISFSLQSQLWLQRAETYARTRWNPGLDQPDKFTGYLPALPQNAFCYIKMIPFDLAELNPIIVVIVKCSFS